MVISTLFPGVKMTFLSQKGIKRVFRLVSNSDNVEKTLKNISNNTLNHSENGIASDG